MLCIQFIIKYIWLHATCLSQLFHIYNLVYYVLLVIRYSIINVLLTCSLRSGNLPCRCDARRFRPCTHSCTFDHFCYKVSDEKFDTAVPGWGRCGGQRVDVRVLSAATSFSQPRIVLSRWIFLKLTLLTSSLSSGIQSPHCPHSPPA